MIAAMDSMMKQIILSVLCISVLFAGMTEGKDVSKTTFDGRFNSRCNPWLRNSQREMCEIPFSRLLAVPEKYDGKLITVTGFLVKSFGRPVLFPDKESYDADLQFEGIELIGDFKINQELMDEMNAGVFPVTVVGSFDAHYEGPDIRRLGAIHGIYSVMMRKKIPEN